MRCRVPYDPVNVNIAIRYRQLATAHVNIGSNLGDSHALLERAISGISLLSVVADLRCSGFIKSEPWGFESAHGFLNVGLELSVDCGPEELFRELISVQNGICAAGHRGPAGEYADRFIDIDLIYYDDELVEMPELPLPHPRMHMREFVLLPIVELSPCWRHPVSGLTAAEMLACLNGG